MMTQPKPLPTTNAPQEGFVLIVGLVILGLLTMLALSSMRDTTMQEKMAGASRDSGLAFQAAESALRDAENCITATTPGCAFDAAANDAHFAQDDAAFPAGLRHNDLFDASYWAGIDPPGNPTDLAGVPSKAKGDTTDGVNYIIRQVSTVAGAAGGDGAAVGVCDASDPECIKTESQTIYEITARGAGASGAGQSVLRVYFRN